MVTESVFTQETINKTRWFSVIEIAKALKKSDSNIYTYIKRLEDSGIIESKKAQTKTLYKISDVFVDIQIYNFMTRYERV